MNRWLTLSLGLVLLLGLAACPKVEQEGESGSPVASSDQPTASSQQSEESPAGGGGVDFPTTPSAPQQQASKAEVPPGQKIMGMETGGDIILNAQWRQRMLGKGLATDHYWELQIVAAQVRSFLKGEGRFPESYEEVRAMGYAIIDPGVRGLNLTKQALRMVVSGQVRTETDAPLTTMQIVVQPEGMLPSEMMGGQPGGPDLSIAKELADLGITTREEARKAVKASRIVRDLSHLAYFFVVEKGRVPKSSQELLDYGKVWIIQQNLVDPWTGAPVTFTDQGGSHVEFASRQPSSPDQIGTLNLRYLALPESLSKAKGSKLFRESVLSSDWFHFWN